MAGNIKDIEIYGISGRKVAKGVIILSIVGSAIYAVSVVASLVWLPVSAFLWVASPILGFVPWKLMIGAGLAYGAYRFFRGWSR